MASKAVERAKIVLEGRLPVRLDERVYKKYLPYTWTWVSFMAATWSFLMGSYLPYLGDLRLVIVGYMAATILGIVTATICVSPLSLRFGVDAGDATKPTFGANGAMVPVVVLAIGMMGWTVMLTCLSGRSVASIIARFMGAGESNETVVVVAALIFVVLVWLSTIKGPQLFAKVNDWIAPTLCVVATLLLIALLREYGTGLVNLNVSEDKLWYTSKWMGVLLIFEFGFANGVNNWPIMGALGRLVEHPKHLYGPPVIGSLLGLGYINIIAAWAAIASGDTDPSVWAFDVGGSVLGAVVLVFVIAGNIPTSTIMMHSSAMALQQIPALARARWSIVVAILLVPAVVSAFFSNWILAHVMTWLTYSGLILYGIVSVMLVDAVILRRMHISVRDLFTRSSKGRYYFWGGVNWVAILASVVGTGLYLWLYNPVTLATKSAFNFAGAAIPSLTVTAAIYFLLVRFVVIPMRKGGYERYQEGAPSAEVSDAEISV